MLTKLQKTVRFIATPLRKEYALGVFMLGVFVLTSHFTHLPVRKEFNNSLLDFCFTIILTLTFLSLLPRRWRQVGRYLCALAMLGMCWTEAFLYQRFKMAYDPTMFCLVTETNGQESNEFLWICLRSGEFWTTIGSFALLILASIGLRYAAPYLCKRVPLLQRIATLLSAALLIGITLFSQPAWWNKRCKMVNYLCLTQSGQAERESSRPYYTSPMRLLYSVKYYGLTSEEGDTFSANTMKLAQNPIEQADTLPAPPSIVLIIGESYNKQHAQIYGYSRPTTPMMSRMKRQGQLISFSDVVTPWNITSQAMKWMMSTASIGTSNSWADGVLWPALFKQAGWPVAFITNQYTPVHTKNKVDYSGSFFLNTQPLDSLAFSHRNRRKYQYDGEMLCELDSLPEQFKSASPHLVIVHLIGQHMDARLRVPESWWHWKASDYAREDLTEKERQVLADYDNATRYNDNVFNRVCKRFSSEDVVVVYLSDHGDEVYDPELKMYGRNHMQSPSSVVLRNEYEISFVVWTSARCRQRHPDLIKSLRAARDLPFMTDDICHMLLGIGQISSTYYQPERNPLSPTFNTQRKRLIRGQKAY